MVSKPRGIVHNELSLSYIGENMKQTKRTEYFKKQIDDLKYTVCSLEAENRVLVRENESLKKINASKQVIINSLSDELTAMKDKCLSYLAELHETQKEYKEVVASIYQMRKKYKKEMETFLAGLRK